MTKISNSTAKSTSANHSNETEANPTVQNQFSKIEATYPPVDTSHSPNVLDEIHPEEKITDISPGQIFLVHDGKFVAQPCWLLFGEYIPDNYRPNEDENGVCLDYEDDEGHDEEYDTNDDDFDTPVDDYWKDTTFFCIPLLPEEYTDIQEFFIKNRFKHHFNIEFMEKQCVTYDTNFNLKLFLRYMPHFSKKLKLSEVMKLIKVTLKQNIHPNKHESELSQTQFYVTTDPDQDMLLLCFEQNAWRPRAYSFESYQYGTKNQPWLPDFDNQNQTNQYWLSSYGCLLDLYHQTPSVSEYVTDLYFEDCPQSIIDAFNQGIVGKICLQPKNNEYSPAEHAKKVLIIPTYWYFSNDETQITYDFLGTWHANQTQDKLYLNLGAFRAWHAAGHPDTGFLTRLI